MQVQVLRLLLFVLTGFLRGQPINLDMQPVFQTISRNQVTPILLGREGFSSFTKVIYTHTKNISRGETYSL